MFPLPLSLDPTGQASLGATSLTFTKQNWNVPQTVRVTGVDDFIDDGTVIFMSLWDLLAQVTTNLMTSHDKF